MPLLIPAVPGAAVPGGSPTGPALAPSGGAPLEDAAMTLVDHLGELRNRLVKTVVAVVLLAAVGFWRASAIIDVLRAPIGDRILISLSPGGFFFLYVKIALVTGLILGMPVILYQIWAFISPGLTPE
ncbi:MAG TPA: twin-arginine translocase subunit TatC, partial [Candidatus Acidoferrum sp.]|nr:twin-arginine translocase subunit TatC [Candidatus Acidoferrum sp.]